MKKSSLFLKYFINITTLLVILLLLHLSPSIEGIGLTSFLYFFGLIPVIDYFLGNDEKNLLESEEDAIAKSGWFDFIMYLSVILYFSTFTYFLYLAPTLSWFNLIAASVAMGFGCGLYGINLGHEFGHRDTVAERVLAQILLGTSYYSQFYIAHNKIHHRMVSTPDDVNTALKGESVYYFWMKSTFLTTFKSFELEVKRLKGKGSFPYGLNNLFIRQKLIELTGMFLIYQFLGIKALIGFFIAAVFGILLLECANYIEHYGLLRKKNASGRYAKVDVTHSWNSSSYLSQVLLFGLSRHSDHHANAKRKYQILRHFDESPQLPFGYPTMVLMSFFPPLYKKTMDKLLPNS